jgi:FKBP-type peptidyl-prolyl cis-trans isomerase FkpA
MNNHSRLMVGTMVLALALSRGNAEPAAAKSNSSQVGGFTVPNLSSPTSDDSGLSMDGFHGIGSVFVKNNRLDQLGWTEQQAAAFVEGVRAALAGKGYPPNEATRRVGADMMRRVQQVESAQKQIVPGGFDQPGKLEAYLKDTKKRLRMQESDTGLLYLIKLSGRGARPMPTDTVVVTLVGTDAEGKVPLPEISGENVQIKMADLLPGLREGVQMMAIGSEAIFVLTPALSFGAGNWPTGVGPHVPLTFVVTLHEVLAAGK